MQISRIILILLLFFVFFEIGLFSSYTLATGEVPDPGELINMQISTVTSVFSPDNVGGLLIKDPDNVNVTNRYELADKLSEVADVDGVNVENMTITTVDDTDKDDDPIIDDKPIVNNTYHSFTESGLDSDVFTISGNLSTGKGSVTYEGEELTKCLKIESSTSIEFTISNNMTLILVFGGTTDASGKKIKINDKKYEITNNILEIELESGTYKITKGDTVNLFYIILK